jgi:hypothetical protein
VPGEEENNACKDSEAWFECVMAAGCAVDGGLDSNRGNWLLIRTLSMYMTGKRLRRQTDRQTEAHPAHTVDHVPPLVLTPCHAAHHSPVRHLAGKEDGNEGLVVHVHPLAQRRLPLSRW